MLGNRPLASGPLAASFGVVSAVGAAAGTSTVAAVGKSDALSVGASGGLSTAAASGSSTALSVGRITGTSTAAAVGASLATSVGNAAGTSTAISIASGAYIGSASGTSTAGAVSSTSYPVPPVVTSAGWGGGISYNPRKVRYEPSWEIREREEEERRLRRERERAQRLEREIQRLRKEWERRSVLLPIEGEDVPDALPPELAILLRADQIRAEQQIDDEAVALLLLT